MNESRAASPGMDGLLGKTFPVLDHGFVRVVDYMGNDAAIVQAARVSYGAGTKSLRQDRGLIRYLMRHWHTTPFEMCELKLHVKLPIFVARQWIRHRTANVNEYSARYSVMEHEFYVPDRKYVEESLAVNRSRRRKERASDQGQASLFSAEPEAVTVSRPEELAAQSTANKQGRDSVVSDDEASESAARMSRLSNRAYGAYLRLMNQTTEGEPIEPDRTGLARELARLVLPVNYYTQWYWKTDLHNLFHFLRLRADSHAQYEIRCYADAIAGIVQQWVPLAWEAFQDYRLGGHQLSSGELRLLRGLLSGDEPGNIQHGLTSRELKELREKLQLDEDALS